MKKKLLLLTVIICAFVILGSGSVFAAEEEFSVIGENCMIERISSGDSVCGDDITLSNGLFLDDYQIRQARTALGVPQSLTVYIMQYEAYYWNAGDLWLVPMNVYYGQTLVARADVDLFTGELIKSILNYAPAVFSFIDTVPSNWYYDAVKYAYDHALMAGTSVTNFSPNVSMTRGMMVTVLYRMVEDDGSLGDNPFTDVKSSDWYRDAVIWAYQNGIVNGYGNGKFGPNDPITREQMAAILYRFSDLYGLNTDIAGNIYTYADYGNISYYAVDSMRWACGTGLINGMGNNRLEPQGTATRAQMATVLQRFCQNFLGR